MPKFSIIITVYNKEKYIFNTINSVLNQTIDDYEIIVVNDGSTDDSKYIITQFDDDRLTVYNIENRGAAGARNYGIQKAAGELIALLDGDDFWHPFFLNEILLLTATYPEEHIYATAIEYKSKEITYDAKYSIDEKEYQVLNYFKGSKLTTLLTSSSIAVKQSVFKNVGYFDEDIVSGQDTDLWIRFGLSYNIAFSKKVCVQYIYAEESLSNSTNSNVNNKCRFDKFEKEERTNPDLKKILDNNRFSLAIQSKRNKDQENFDYYISKIDHRNLNWKQKLLLKLNSQSLNLLIRFKTYLKKKKVILGVFD